MKRTRFQLFAAASRLILSIDPVSSIRRFTQILQIRLRHSHQSAKSSIAVTFREEPILHNSADHTGITVSNLERSLAFWRDVLGFELSHTAHQKDELAQEITGVEGAEIKLAVLKAPGGHKIELLEYLAPADRKRANLRPCDVGSVHVALLVEDLDAVLAQIAASGWEAAGKPQTLKTGPNAGKRVVYVRDA